ncbi:MAG: OadG-related small transporter subunit [Clostridia bacterium]|nr:OadG-related small transporter subunit [Clostridia bacterium]
MIESLKKASELNQGLFVMLCGIGGVFLVLILFFLLIKGLAKAFPEKEDKENTNT